MGLEFTQRLTFRTACSLYCI